MRGLRDYELVSLYGPAGRQDARVIALADALVWLAPSAGQPALDELPARMELAFTRDHRIALVPGRAERDPSGGLLFRADDPRPFRNQRLDPRLELELPVEATPLTADGTPAGPAVACRTLDVSAGGCALAGSEVGPVGTRLQLAIDLPRDLGTVTAFGTVLSTGPGRCGVAFAALDTHARTLLRELVLGARRAVAARFDEAEAARRTSRHRRRG